MFLKTDKKINLKPNLLKMFGKHWYSVFSKLMYLNHIIYLFCILFLIC